MTRARYVGEAKSKKKEWLEKIAEQIQDEFEEHGHGFILIPWADLDEMGTADDIANTAIGTCVTDCTDPFMFAVSMAGAITSFAMTSKDGNKNDKAAKALVKAISDIVNDVAKMRRNNGE